MCRFRISIRRAKKGIPPSSPLLKCMERLIFQASIACGWKPDISTKNGTFTTFNTRSMTMKQFIYGVTMVLVVALSGCGSSGSSGSLDGNSVVESPLSAAEVKTSYDAAPWLLHSYFFEIASFGKSSNPDTVTTSSNYLGTQLTIVYRGAEIYNETHGWGVYMSHGFMRDGTYIILLREYNEGSYSGVTRFFINGKEVALSLQYPVNDIREYGEGWLIFQCQNGSIRSASISANWVMFKPGTLEIKQFGDYGLIEEIMR